MIDAKDVLAYLDKIALPYKAKRFFAENIDLYDFTNNFQNHKETIIKNLGEAVYLKLKNAISYENIVKNMQEMQKYGVKLISVLDKEYPDKLKNLEDYPVILYYKGDISLLKENCIAIIGTRQPTFYGREVTTFFARELAKAGLVTVSGLAYGLDSEVAYGTLKADGKTIAVLGGGLDKIYPEQNTNLAEQIIEAGGLLLSEYPLFHAPAKYSFLARNRIISGLSLGIVIVEAGKKSGTLNTAKHAIDQGKELFVVPGSIFSAASDGTNALISELPETFTTSPKQVLERLNITVKNDKQENKKLQMGQDEKLIVKTLYEGDMDFDTLANKTGILPKTLFSLLTRMEISGLIKKLPGNFYSL